MFTVLPTEILAKEEKLFWNKLLNCKYEISVSPKEFWSGSRDNYRISYDHSEVYSCSSITINLSLGKAFMPYRMGPVILACKNRWLHFHLNLAVGLEQQTFLMTYFDFQDKHWFILVDPP